MEKFQFESPRSEADEQQAHSMIPKTDRYTDTLKQALTRQRHKSLNMNAYGRKGRKRKRPYTNAYGKERKNRPQMPVAMKERPNHKCWWQTKNGCPNQASKQLTPNERNKAAEATSKSQTVAYLQA